MGLFMITNQHEPEDCPDLADEMAKHYEVKQPAGPVNVYCTCGNGAHRMFLFIEANGPAEAMLAVPPALMQSKRTRGFLAGTNTIVQVENAYSFAR